MDAILSIGFVTISYSEYFGEGHDTK